MCCVGILLIQDSSDLNLRLNSIRLYYFIYINYYSMDTFVRNRECLFNFIENCYEIHKVNIISLPERRPTKL